MFQRIEDVRDVHLHTRVIIHIPNVRAGLLGTVFLFLLQQSMLGGGRRFCPKCTPPPEKWAETTI